MPYTFTTRADGDTRGCTEWAMAEQVHDAVVKVATSPGRHGDADALVTTTPGLRIAVRVADCAPIALLSDGVVGVVHAGWRGIAAGVIPNALQVMRELGAGDIHAVLGPCIHAECYEFGATELDDLALRLGGSVRGVTSWGAPALDVVAAVRIFLPEVTDESVCTACSPEHWSHRARGDAERQAVVAWL